MGTVRAHDDILFSLLYIGIPRTASTQPLVHVRMENGHRVPASLWHPVWIHGTLTVEKTANLYESASFKMDGTSITSYER